MSIELLILFVLSKGEPDVKEIYRALAFTAAHLHLINRRHLAVTEPFQAECHLMENSFYQQNIGMWVVFCFKIRFSTLGNVGYINGTFLI